MTAEEIIRIVEAMARAANAENLRHVSARWFDCRKHEVAIEVKA